MKKIFEGVYVVENGDYRKYILEAQYSEHIKCVTSKEDATQEIELKDNAPVDKILELIQSHDFLAMLEENGTINVKTEDPVKLVKLLCDQHYIAIEQAIAIIAHEIEHIKNPAMRSLVSGRKRLKAIREVVIQNRAAIVAGTHPPLHSFNKDSSRSL